MPSISGGPRLLSKELILSNATLLSTALQNGVLSNARAQGYGSVQLFSPPTGPWYQFATISNETMKTGNINYSQLKRNRICGNFVFKQ